MLFKISHIQDNGTMAKVETIESINLYEAYKEYLDNHKGVHPLALVKADDADAVRAITEVILATTKDKEEKKMDKSAVKAEKKAAPKKEAVKAAPKKESVKKPVEKKAEVKVESVETKAETKAEPVGIKATYELNAEHNGVEIKFTEKPSAEIRAELKALKFRWHGVKKVWYTKQSDETIALAKKLCGVKDEVKTEIKKEEPKAETKAETPKKPSRKGIESYKPKEGERICDRLVKALNRTDGIKAEIVTTKEGEDGWLWVTGESTKEHKDKLKSLGFFWSGKKKAWYLSPAPLKRGHRSQFGSMDAVRAAALA